MRSITLLYSHLRMRLTSRYTLPPGFYDRVIIIPLLIFFLFVLAQVYQPGELVVAAPISNELWGVSQDCSFAIEDPDFSIDGPKNGFDGRTAACQWIHGVKDAMETAWTYTQFESTQLTSIQNIKVDVGFFISEWGEDSVDFQISFDHGKHWTSLETFDKKNPPPGTLLVKSYEVNPAVNLSGMFSSINDAQVRFLTEGDFKDDFTIHLDEVRLVALGITPPTETPINTETPTSLPTTILTETPAVEGTLTPTEPAQDIEPPTQTITPTLGIAPTESHSTTTPSPINSNPTATATPILSATSTGTATPVLSPTPTTTLPSSPTATLAMPPPINDPPLPENVQRLWGTDQRCTYPILNPADSIDQLFNGRFASCTGNFAQDQGEWVFDVFQSTMFTHIDHIILEIRLVMIGLSNGQMNLQLFDGIQWSQIDQIDPGRSESFGDSAVFSYDVSNILTSPEKINQASVKLMGSNANNQADSPILFIDGIRFLVSGGVSVQLVEAPIPTPPAPPPAPTSVPGNGDPHADHSHVADSCSACHRSHTGSGGVLRQSWPEESVCFACHTNGGTGTNVQPAFTNYSNTATGIFKHDVFQTSAIHQPGENSAGSFGGGMRHVECEDCHNPHDAARGASSPPILQVEMVGVSGVDPVWTGPGAPSSYTWATRAVREFQVCFLCHSSFTTLPSYVPDGWNGASLVPDGLRKLTNLAAPQVPDHRDLALEFNPYQNSFHPVAAQGRNQNIPSGSFVSGWSQTSLVYCTDCHFNPNSTTEGAGPHGSPRLHLLGGQANYSTVFASGTPRVSSSEICFRCHNYQTYVTGQNSATNFREHQKHMDNNWGTTCYTCHDTHGSEQLHLINLDASVMTFLNGRNSQSAWYYDPATGRAGCFLSCHGESHNPKEYTP